MSLLQIMSTAMLVQIHGCSFGYTILRQLHGRVLFHLLENHLPRLA